MGAADQAGSARRDGAEEEAHGGVQGRMSRWVKGKEGTRAQLDQCNPVCLIMAAVIIFMTAVADSLVGVKLVLVAHGPWV